MEANKLSRFVLLMLLLVFLQSAYAETITIGEGTVLHQGLPIEPIARYSYSQQLFMASEVGSGGVISQLGFHYNVASNLFFEGNRQLKLWLGHSSRSTMPAWISTDSLSLVYDGMLSESDFSAGLPGNGWLLVNLSQPFSYNGTDNLVIAADENSYEYGSSSDDFLCTDSGLQRSIQFQSATVNPDPDALPSSGFTLKTHRSNLRLEIAAVHYFPVQPLPTDNATQVAIDTDFSWISNCSSFDLLLGTHLDSLATIAQNLSASQWQSQNPLQYNRQYYWQVIGHYSGNSYPSALWSFITASEDISPPRNLTAVYNQPVVQLNWQPPTLGMVHYYCIYRNSAPLINTPDPAYEDADLQPEQTYYYYVTAFSPSGSESTPSNLVSVTIPGSPDALVFQGFEDIPAFTNVFPTWQNLDFDNSPSWSWDNADFPHEGEPFGWLCFAPGQTNPPLGNVSPASGSKMVMAMSALNPPNNDWLISPRLRLGTTAALSFKARSATAAYGLERLRVLISTGDTAPSAFNPLSSGAYLEVPDEWQQYDIDLGAYQNQSVYLAWQCVSIDAFALFVDDIEINSPGGWVGAQDEYISTASLSCYPNPSRGSFCLRTYSKSPFSVELYDLRGRKLYSADKLSSFSSDALKSPLSSGIYFLRITQDGTSQVLKQVILH